MRTRSTRKSPRRASRDFGSNVRIMPLLCVRACVFPPLYGLVCMYTGGLSDTERAHGADRAPGRAQVVTNEPFDAFPGVLPHHSRGDDDVPLQEPECVT